MELEYKGYKIVIERDENPDDPRNWDNLGTMTLFHRGYTLGDKTSMSPAVLKGMVGRVDVISLPVWALDHSGLSLDITDANFRHQYMGMDHGLLGYIWVTAEKVRKDFSAKNISPKLRQRVLKCLEAEVAEYNQYLNGDVWGYSISKDDEDHDSCWGFYGEDAALANAKQLVNHLAGK